MSKSNSESSLLKNLEFAVSVLQDLLSTLSNLNSTLKPIEREMKVSDFTSSGEFVQGASKGIVCVLSGLIQSDPLQRILAKKGANVIGVDFSERMIQLAKQEEAREKLHVKILNGLLRFTEATS